MNDTENYKITYNFKWADGKEYSYTINLNHESQLLIVDDPEKAARDWTDLEFHKCSHCPLSADSHKNCPVALGLSSFLEDFSQALSYEEVEVTVETDERIYAKSTQLQSGIYSIMGLIMATSGCPKMNPLKNMARFHLPFATLEETLIRVLSFYLIKQYFVTKQDSSKPHFDLTQLENNYKEINLVNQGVLSRIKSISQKDANKNALVVLQAFASMLTMSIAQNFEDIEEYFTD